MPAFNVVEDDRDWLEDTIGEIIKRFDPYNDTEPKPLIAQIRARTGNIKEEGLELLKLLEALLVLKKSV